MYYKVLLLLAEGFQSLKSFGQNVNKIFKNWEYNVNFEHYIFVCSDES